MVYRSSASLFVNNEKKGGWCCKMQGKYVGLPGELVRVLRNDRPMTIGVTEGRHWVAQLREEPDFIPQINKPKWSDLELWTSEPSSWSSQHPNLKLSKDERKKQDVIYELYLTEKHYCQVLVILQQVYQEGLRVRQLLSDEKRNELIPAVLDALLDFHLNFLRKLRTRSNESVIVSGVADIVLSEFEFGDKNRAAIFAYTEICSKKEFCGRLYDIYRVRNFEVRKFFDEFEKNPIFKDRTFKMCLLIIAQRLTKYPVLLDQILKVEPESGKEICEKAVQAVKKFAEHVDSELNKIEMIRRWDRIRSQIARSTLSRHNQNVSFTYADLLSEDGHSKRKLLRVGDATCYSNPSNFKNEDGAEIKLVLFDDVLVLLSRAQGKSGFVFHDRGPSGCSVIKVKTMIVRDVPRKELMLFIIARNNPASDLIPIEFLSKKEFSEWRKVLETAIQNAPSFVRRGGESEWEHQEECDETKFSEQLSRWDLRLLHLFEERKAAEDELAVFIEQRMRWIEQLNNHLMHIPVKKHRDSQKAPQISEKVKATVKRKFDELRARRFEALSKVMEKAQKASEEQFLTYFDDKYDVNVWSPDDDSSTTDRNKASGSRLKYIRRTQTFNGADVERNVVIRRHTTEPALYAKKLSESEKAAMLSSERLERLSLTLPPAAVRNLAHIVQECVDVRIENMKLRDDIALMALQLSVFKARPTATSFSTLEVLRNKQNKLQEEKDAFNALRENLYADIKKREDEIAEKEKNLQASEEQLEEKWKTFLEASTSPTTSSDGLTRYRPLSSSRSSTSFRPLSMHNISSMSRALQTNPLSKSPSGSSMPLHLAEKTIIFEMYDNVPFSSFLGNWLGRKAMRESLNNVHFDLGNNYE
uniref:DH domain-containing protein n=1 Tax=Syphacia muris TaxID=451379 RepID=A0A0N5AN30_9BILA